MIVHPRYLTDEKGHRLAVVLDIAEFEQLLAEAGEDPDAGLELRSEVRTKLESQARAFDEGHIQGQSITDVRRELGLD